MKMEFTAGRRLQGRTQGSSSERRTSLERARSFAKLRGISAQLKAQAELILGLRNRIFGACCADCGDRLSRAFRLGRCGRRVWTAGHTCCRGPQKNSARKDIQLYVPAAVSHGGKNGAHG